MDADSNGILCETVWRDVSRYDASSHRPPRALLNGLAASAIPMAVDLDSTTIPLASRALLVA
jgi:hypothetical protein